MMNNTIHCWIGIPLPLKIFAFDNTSLARDVGWMINSFTILL